MRDWCNYSVQTCGVAVHSDQGVRKRFEAIGDPCSCSTNPNKSQVFLPSIGSSCCSIMRNEAALSSGVDERGYSYAVEFCLNESRELL